MYLVSGVSLGSWSDSLGKMDRRNFKKTYSTNCWWKNNEALKGNMKSRQLTLKIFTDINAQSPQYSMKSGRVASKNAGEASKAVANPALMAYFDLRSTSTLPIVQSTFFNLPVLESWFQDGVWIVSGAWGRIFGKLEWNLRLTGMMWALGQSVSGNHVSFELQCSRTHASSQA